MVHNERWSLKSELTVSGLWEITFSRPGLECIKQWSVKRGTIIMMCVYTAWHTTYLFWDRMDPGRSFSFLFFIFSLSFFLSRCQEITQINNTDHNFAWKCAISVQNMTRLSYVTQLVRISKCVISHRSPLCNTNGEDFEMCDITPVILMPLWNFQTS